MESQATLQCLPQLSLGIGHLQYLGDQMLYFKPEEFNCKCSYPDCDAAPLDLKFLAMADTLRGRWGKPLIINSGRRCKRHNAEVGGAPNSEHMKGIAGDFKTANRAESEELAKLADELGFGGVGIYNSWVHCDTGPRRRWAA